MPTDLLAVLDDLPYCGAPATPADVTQRWNLDPWIFVAFAVAGLLYIGFKRAAATDRHASFSAGWLVTLLAFISPLCAASVALFSVRTGQHMILMLIAAPLLAWGLPTRKPAPLAAGIAFFATLWLWHAPSAYAAALRHDVIYWLMQLSLLAASVWLWQALLPARGAATGKALAVGFVSSVHMGILGALLTFAPRPFYAWHLDTTAAWNMTALADQQLSGLLMWVPGGIAFLALGILAFVRAWRLGNTPAALNT